MALLEIEVRNHQEAQEDQWIDDEQHAEPGVTTREVSDAGRDECDGEAKIGELLDLERNTPDEQRQHTEDFGDRELDLEIQRQAEVGESSFWSIGKWKVVTLRTASEAEL